MQRVAVVSGGADGIGKEVSLELLDAGYAVAAFDLKDDKIAELNESLKEKKFIALKCNAIEEESVKANFAKVIETFGRVDVLVNVVGGSMGVNQPVDQIDVEAWDKVITLNLRSLFLCTKEAVKIMRAQNYGRIVNFSSMAGRSRSVFGGAPYAAAKAGVIGFTRQCSKDMGPIGVTINAIAPGTVMSGDRIGGFWAKKTEQEKQKFFEDNPSRRLGDPKDIARTVLFLCHEDASYINGAVIDVNGGMWVG
ncbi:MAG: SDR family oxidoreductase [Pyramidobacter sp.]|jgi:NAD(P)-dependent dehydrogenase (short-subunit alcohol dehydrogenase family)|nr:SDR family oxidoreductase [Pyramidobacter sp.]